ncbi:hypothetical protein AXF42_Ash008594 [Apostasia shenzhenica]|uniref:Uncharacterized protein n=1 Tax=Apostasia shenzhenica TaxID=1088818 RepID=A0A2I0B1U2_9ASPA|nr:hypothetical protein AXF42_Ash008594 [Apostasia shenzhenica]
MAKSAAAGLQISLVLLFVISASLSSPSPPESAAVEALPGGQNGVACSHDEELVLLPVLLRAPLPFCSLP